MKRTITLFQPIASLVVKGIKQIETRHWPTKVRGELYIHAAAAFPPDHWVERYINDPVFRFHALGGHRHTLAMALDEFESWPRGAILGRVELVDCVEGSLVRDKVGALDYRREKALGDLVTTDTIERFGWFLKNARELATPIKAKGSQGFWSADEYISGNEKFKRS